MEQRQEKSTRKQFLLWGATILSSLTLFRFTAGKKRKTSTTIKMLSQEGKLVEVDIEQLSHNKGKKATQEQLKNWVNKSQDKTKPV